MAGRQFWLGPARSGVTVTFWADPDIIHLLVAGVRIKSIHSHLGQRRVLAAEILRGRRVTVRIDEHTLTFLDPDTRELLRTRPNPLTAAEVGRLRTAPPAGPPPQPVARR